MAFRMDEKDQCFICGKTEELMPRIGLHVQIKTCGKHSDIENISALLDKAEKKLIIAEKSLQVYKDLDKALTAWDRMRWGG